MPDRRSATSCKKRPRWNGDNGVASSRRIWSWLSVRRIMPVAAPVAPVAAQRPSVIAWPLLKYAGDFVWYLTDTTAGSSGSPAFNQFWQVIALHHSGVPKKDSQGRILTKDGKVWDPSMDESLIDWIANEGARVSAIVADLKVAVGASPVIRPVLDQVARPAPVAAGEMASAPLEPVLYGSNAWLEQSSDATSLVVPIRVPMPVIKRQVLVVPGAAAAAAPVAPITPAGPRVGVA